MIIFASILVFIGVTFLGFMEYAKYSEQKEKGLKTGEEKAGIGNFLIVLLAILILGALVDWRVIYLPFDPMFEI